MANWIERNERMANYMAEGFNPKTGCGLRCAVCARKITPGLTVSDPGAATLDHMVSRHHTGNRWDRDPQNLIALCPTCNCAEKREMDMADYLATKPAKVRQRALARIAKRQAAKADFGKWLAAAEAAGYAKRKR